MLNCNGQVSGTFGNIGAITIIPGANDTLTINNLAYKYINDKQQQNNFSYQMSLPLIPTIAIKDSYNGYADVYMNGASINNNQVITLVKKLQY